MDTLYSREAAEEARHRSPEDRLEDITLERDELHNLLDHERSRRRKAEAEVIRLTSLLREAASWLYDLGCGSDDCDQHKTANRLRRKLKEITGPREEPWLDEF
jgi:hypothetical protein